MRATGGLADTVVDFDARSNEGTGFVFIDYNAPDMMRALKRALETYSDPGRWRGLVMRGMVQDWSWEKSARKYVQLYQRIYRLRHSTPEEALLQDQK